MTNATFISVGFVALALSLGACTLSPTLLEGDDEVGESEGSPTNTDADTDTGTDTGDETGAELLPECIAGTNLDGSTQAPVEFRFEGDVVDCASGFGHDAPPLAIGFTSVDVDGSAAIHSVGEQTRLISRTPIRFSFLDAQGQLLADFASPFDEQMFLTGSALDDEGRLVFAVEAVDDESKRRVGMLDATWTSVVWSVEVSGSVGPVVRVGDEFLIGQANPAARVMRVSAQGELLDTLPVVVDSVRFLAASDAGFLVADGDTLARYALDGTLDWVWESNQYQLNAVAADFDAAIVIGSDGAGDPWIARIEREGLAWETSYLRADAWHPAGAPEESRELVNGLFNLIALGDGSFVAGGPQFVDGFDRNQPFVVHFDGDGETLGQDRLYLDATPYMAGGGEGSAYVWMAGSFGRALRRYSP
ncbi:hypothetical protein ACNOYE_38950 [Nannocystaceae bacterium ST9]